MVRNGMNRDFEARIILCINSVLNYLRSCGVSNNVVGFNMFGDASKEFDLVAEDILVNCIVKALNDVLIVGEERGVRKYGRGEWVAVIDPVDGSTNFDAGIPWSSISVALARGTSKSHITLKDVVLAIVAEIFRDRIYIYRNGSVEVIGGRSARRSPPRPVLLSYFETPNSYKPVENYMLMRGRVALRSLGSAALDIVYVGLGNAEGFIDVRSKLRNVDVAAALKIALAMGARAHICNTNDVTDVQLDNLIKVECVVVGYDDVYLAKLMEAVQKPLSSAKFVS
ncbi:MAG: inositol monophosphatase family protein [Ignisphaera sp.]|nr:hypothetical protein [Ignisphaera sp.]MDW8085292.1 inositol monophosphatase family protein [Ignisphaera sp.]